MRPTGRISDVLSDRIGSLKVLEEYFVPRLRSGDEELAASFGSFLDGEPVDVVLRFDPGIKVYLLRRRWHPSQEEKELPDGRLEVQFRVNGLEGIRRWIYRWLPQVEVIEPVKLRKKIREELEMAVEKHGTSRRRTK